VPIAVSLPHEEIVLTGILLASAAFLVAAYATKLPYPIWLVVGGALIGWIPAVPNAALKPDLVLLLLLPPLLYSAAFFSSVHELRRNARPISILAIGLVLATMSGVAVIGHVLIGLPWAVAFVLGAVVSPTDPVAATAIGRRVGAPPRVITIVEGESLVNDSTALVAYKFAVAAVASGSFSLWHAGLEFVISVVVAIAIGLAVAWVISLVARRLDDAPTEILISVLTPFFAYLPAEAVGVSAVLAAVSAGLYLGWNAPHMLTPSTRIQAYAFWEVLTFVINAALFMLLGLQLPNVIDGIEGSSAGSLIEYSAAVAAAVIGIRIAWVFTLAGLPRLLSRNWRENQPLPTGWRSLLLVGWEGMRGAVSLAAALSIPLTIKGGQPFPQRDLVVFLVYVTILVTLVLQGLSLPWLIRRLGLSGIGAAREATTEARARLKAVDFALDRLGELEEEGTFDDQIVRRMRRLYETRRDHLADHAEDDGSGELGALSPQQERGDAYARLRRELQDAQRECVVEMRNDGQINDEIMRRIERDMDLEDVRLER
jgi:CPA1 family monovalent cation:H+ antiporter